MDMSRRKFGLEVAATLTAGAAGGAYVMGREDQEEPPSDSVNDTEPVEENTPTPSQEPESYRVVSVPGENREIRSLLEEENPRELEKLLEKQDEINNSHIFRNQDMADKEGVQPVEIDRIAFQALHNSEYELSKSRKITNQIHEALTHEDKYREAKEPPGLSFNGTEENPETFSHQKFENPEQTSARQAVRMAQKITWNIERETNNRGETSARAENYATGIEAGVNDNTEHHVNIFSSGMNHNWKSEEVEGLVDHGYMLGYLNDTDTLTFIDTVGNSILDEEEPVINIEDSTYAEPDSRAGRNLMLPTRLGNVDNPGEELNEIPDWTTKTAEKVSGAGLFGDITVDGTIGTSRLDFGIESNIAIPDSTFSHMMYALHRYNHNDYEFSELEDDAAEIVGYMNKDEMYAPFMDENYEGNGLGLEWYKVTQTQAEQINTGEITEPAEL